MTRVSNGARRRLAGWAAMLIAAVAAAGAVNARPASAPPAAYVPISAEAQVARMGRGLNVLGYDGFWDGGTARFQARHFAEIKKAGFSTIRVNLQAFRHMDSRGTLDREWLKKLDWVVKTATDNGLIVILDEHDFDLCSEDVQNCRKALLAFWIQVGTRYRAAPNTVLFELLNEPHAKLTPDVWNGLLSEMLAEVRRTNPTRTVVIGPTLWNSLSELKDLKLPEDDRNLVVTFHYYTPMEFTHQGASWVESTKTLHDVSWGDDKDLARLNADLDTVKAWSEGHHRPIFLGEFGAYNKGAMPLRALYTRSVARGAEARGFAWAYWQFDSNFEAWDMKADGWVRPILEALVPQDAQAAK
jgi:endoglucanase